MKKNISGQRIAEARVLQIKKMTQLELSNRLRKNMIRLDRAAVAKIERGLRGVLDFELLAFSEVLGVSPSWLLSGPSVPNIETNESTVHTKVEEVAPVSTEASPQQTRELGFID